MKTHTYVEHALREKGRTKLTPAGEKWALDHTNTMVAKIALAGNDWPESHRITAIRACNKAARKDAAAS